MNVNNIFNLLNKFDKEEDRISAGFGFLLTQNTQILSTFLRKLNITVSKGKLKQVDIETQVAYDDGKSRIDVQLRLYGEFIVFIESKIIRKDNIDRLSDQLNKYAQILNTISEEYKQTALVCITKFPINHDELKAKVNIERNKISCLCWEELLKLIQECRKIRMDIYKQFNEYMGDKMYSKKKINEQKIKDVVEVLVIVTNEENWQLIKNKKIAVQDNGTPDAQYLAFYRTHRKDKPQAITHIANVISTEINVPLFKTVEGVPELKSWYLMERKKDLKDTHKQYQLGELIELDKEIPFNKGGKTIGQVKFKTKMSELLRVKTVSDLKRLKDLES